MPALWFAVLARSAPARGRGVAPPAWETTLGLCAYLLAALALVRLADAVGLEGDARSTCVLVLLCAAGVWLAARGAATGTLLACLAGGAAILTGVGWIADPSAQALRWLLLAELGVLVLIALGHRDRRPGHAAQVANAAAVAALGIAGTIVLQQGLAIGPLDVLAADAPEVTRAWGWSLVLLAAGTGAIGYGAVDRQRGPVLLGVAVLAAFAVVERDGSLLGWPVVLAAVAAFFLVVGLRPSTPLPPPPEDEGDPVEPVRLSRR